MGKLKKIVAVLMAAATVSALSVSAFAYMSPPFEFNLNKKDSEYTGGEIKEDNLSYARVNCTNGNVDETAYIWLMIHNQKRGDCVSYRQKATDLLNYQIDYYDGENGEGLYYMLHGETDSYGAYLKGRWDP